jgi:hypothetical protein
MMTMVMMVVMRSDTLELKLASLSKPKHQPPLTVERHVPHIIRVPVPSEHEHSPATIIEPNTTTNTSSSCSTAAAGRSVNSSRWRPAAPPHALLRQQVGVARGGEQVARKGVGGEAALCVREQGACKLEVCGGVEQGEVDRPAIHHLSTTAAAATSTRWGRFRSSRSSLV